jgi:hypothetical protein
MNTVDLIIQAYTHVATQPGTKKIEISGDEGQKVTAYLCGTIIRIDIKE